MSAGGSQPRPGMRSAQVSASFGLGSLAQSSAVAGLQASDKAASIAFLVMAPKNSIPPSQWSRISRLAARAIRSTDSSRRSEEHTSELQSLMRISYAVFCLQKNKEDTIIPQTKQPQNQ